MSDGYILRKPKPLTVTVGANAAASTEIDKEDYTTGSICIPGTGGTTQITVYAKLGNEDYAIAQDEDDDNIVFTVVPGQPKAMPSSLYTFPLIKLVATAGGATVSVPISLTS